MRGYLTLVAISLWLTGCNLLKNTSRETASSSQSFTRTKAVKMLEEKDWLSRSESLQFSVTTDSTNYSIQLWPKGLFTYSPERGFSGSAEKILITGSSTKKSSQSELAAQEKQDKGKKENIEKEYENAKESQQNKVIASKVSWKLILSGLLLFGVAVWAVYRKLIN